MIMQLSALFQRISILIVGPLGDRIGRKRVIQVLIIGIFVITSFTQLLLQFVRMSVNAK
jgi:MFS family permease